MAEEVDILVKLRGAKEAGRDADRVSHAIHGIGSGANQTVAPLHKASKATDRLAKSSKGGTKAAAGFAGGLGSFAKAGIAGGAIAGLYGISKFARLAGQEYTEAARVTALTNNALRTNGKLAGINATQIGNLANSLSLKAGVDDEAIQSGENLLLTFKAVSNTAGKGNDIFTQSTKTALDMSAAYGTPLRNSFIQLGKAMQDPVKGAAALKKVGAISASDIVDLKAMAKAGKSIKDQQKFILAAVNDARVKGAAAANAQPIDKLKVAWANLAESVGRKAAPLLNRAISSVSGFLNDMMAGKGSGGKVVDFLKDLGNKFLVAGGQIKDALVGAYHAVTDVVKGFKSGKTWAVALVAALAGFAAVVVTFKIMVAVIKAWTIAQWALNVAMDANPIGLIILAVAGLAAAFWVLYKKSKTFRNILGFIGTVAVTYFKTFWSVAGPVLKWLWHAFINISKTIQYMLIPVFKVLFGVAKAVLGVWWEIAKFAWKTIFKPLVSAITSVAKTVIDIASPIFEPMKKAFNLVIQSMKDTWDEFQAFLGHGKKATNIQDGTPTGGASAFLPNGKLRTKAPTFHLPGEPASPLFKKPSSIRKSAAFQPLANGGITVHSTIMLDGKAVGKSVGRHTQAAYNRR